MGYPRFQRSRDFKFARRTAGDVSTSSTSWVNFDTGVDLTLHAQVGDVIEAAISTSISNGADHAFTDVGTLVSAAIVNVFSTGAAESGSGQGVKAWQGFTGVDTGVSGAVMYTIQSGDLASGFVTLRLRIRVNSGTSKTWRASSTEVFQWYAKNLGPADPN